MFHGTLGCKEFFADKALSHMLTDHDEYFADLVGTLKSPYLYEFSFQVRWSL